MQAIIYPNSVQSGACKLPPSKSMAHRAIICASLAQGKSVISNLDYSVDISTTLEGMRQLGAKIIEHEDSVEIVGIQDFNQCHDLIINCNESGSTLRFFIPIFSLTQQRKRFIGKNRLLKRPQKVYQDLFNQQGLHYLQTEDYIEIEGAIQSGTITLPGDVSSQFISGLLFTLPLCKEDSTIQILPPFESRSYVELTLQMLKKFGVDATFRSENELFIPGNQHYIAHDEEVEGDFSQLGFFAALGVLNGDVKCTGLAKDSLQGDKQILEITQEMQGRIEFDQFGYLFKKSALKGCTIDLANCPDLGPILMVMASFAQGETKIINAQRLRIKESDRIAAMEEELRKVGVKIESDDDTVTIQGPTEWQGNCTLSGHKDHRIVMSLAIGATLASGPITITEAESITKSYPAFFEDLRRQGIIVEES